MNKSLSHSRAERALEAFRHYSALAEQEGLVRQLAEDDILEAGYITLRGQKLANFGTCSYLGLSQDERLIEGAMDALRRYGVSYSSSTTYTAVPLYRDLHERLEQMFGSAVVIAASTTLAHQAALPVIVRPGDDVYVDVQAHASVRAVTPTLTLNGSNVETLPHNDISALKQRLSERTSGKPAWYLTDGVFSMFGDTSPAEELYVLLDEYPDLHIYCDDAHGFGWAGEHGRGQFLDRVGWHDRVVVSVGLSKSFGTLGGVVALPDHELASQIVANGGPLVFGGPLPPSVLGSSIASADIHLSPEIDELQANMRQRIELVNTMAQGLQLPLARFDDTPLWFLIVGPTPDAIALTARMRQLGYYTNVSTFPVVPRGQAGLRFTITNDNTVADVEGLLANLSYAWDELFGETSIEVDLTADSSPNTEKTEGEAIASDA